MPTLIGTPRPCSTTRWTQGEWGKCISKDGKGRCDLFKLDLGEGNKLFTHVTWAEPGNPDKGKP